MSHYYFNAMLGSKILTYCTILNKNSVRKQFLPKVAETLVETCFCQDGLNRFKPRFKPVLAETCQPCIVLQEILFSDTKYRTDIFGECTSSMALSGIGYRYIYIYIYI